MNHKRIPKSEPLKYFSRYIKDIKDMQNKKTENQKMTIKSNKKYHLYRELAYMVDKYGDEIFEWINKNEIIFIKSPKFLKRHCLRKETRIKMIDWMVEVFYIVNSDPRTFECAVHIMDRYIQRTKKIIYDTDIYLIGLTCIYISSKLMDDTPLQLIYISKNIGKGKFSASDIIEKEKGICMSINYDFITNVIYDFLMSFFCDLNVNYFKEINELKGKEIINKYMDFCVILCKLVLYNEGLLLYKASLITIAILSFGFDILNLYEKKLSKDLRHFLFDWINFIINEMNIMTYDLNCIYEEILQTYKKYLYQPNEKNRNLKIRRSKEKYEEQNNLLKYYKDKILV